jgi:hypothetical protein
MKPCTTCKQCELPIPGGGAVEDNVWIGVTLT